jgi:two-component system NtrC family sensor kinase
VTSLKVVDVILNGPDCSTAQCHAHPEGQEILGFVEAELSLAVLDEALLKQGLALTAYVIMFVLTVSLFLGIILYKIVSKPVNEVVQGMEKVAAGDMDKPVQIRSTDEIGKLSRTFNAMIRDLKGARDQREKWTHTLEAEIAKKTEEIKNTHANLVQTEKLASLGRMAAGVAHEINNPLTGVVTFAHLLKQRVPADSTESEDLDVIIEQSERCAKIIKNLLTFARATPSEKGKVSINDVMNRTIFMVKNQEKFHHIKFHAELDESQLVVDGDASQFQQIFLNMFINAADAMGGRGDITAKTKKIMENDEPYVEIEFTDQGCGIKEEDMPKLFEPFFTTKPVGKGTGLGLSVSHGIVKHLGKKPMNKILVIDDEPIVRTSCERTLAPEGYDVTSAASGKEGLEMLEKETFGLVLLDLKMPDMDGIEVLDNIKNKWPDTKVVMVTGYSTVDTAVQALRFGAFNFIEKPFTPDTLLKAVKEVFG